MTTATITSAAPGRLARIRNSLSPAEWRRSVAMIGFIVALHVVGFFLLILASSRHYHIDQVKTFGVGTGILAYTLGLRHAFDADHISAIDNTTRKLMAEGKRPLSTGFWFSLGHSSVVFLLAILLNFGIRALNTQVKNGSSGLHHYTGLIGTLVSGSFLYIIAILNLVILVSILRIFFQLRLGMYNHDELERQLNARGMMSRFFGPLARRVDTPWKMYPIGFLFGLGFDTATEVALLVIAGTAGAAGLPWYAILCLPVLFAAGMSLLDSIDGSFMNFAYGWAFSKPVRKVFYNLTITGLSVAVAVVIGTIELGGLIAQHLNLSGWFWSWFEHIDINSLGLLIAGLFLTTWALALAIWRFGDIEGRWSRSAQRHRLAA